MSTPTAIEAVTTTLRNLIVSGVPDLPNQNVTTRPLDRARVGEVKPDQINLFLYQTMANVAWRNQEMQNPAGDGSRAPLALNLYYLMTAYGQGDDETLSHRWLGQAMSVLHDHPVLGREEIRTALAASELHAQFERIRIAPQQLSLEEMSKLWTAFQSQYRISTAYEVTVVLIDSKRPPRVSPPVLAQGRDDRGATTVAGGTLPLIDEVQPPLRQSSAFLGDELTIRGQSLDDLSAVRFTLLNPPSGHGTFSPILVLPPAVQGTSRELKLTLPDDAEARKTWVAGFYTVAVLVGRNGQVWSSNEVPISLAPRVDLIAPLKPGNVAERDVQSNVNFTVTCSPEVRLAVSDPQHMRFDQPVMLLLGRDREIAPQPPEPPPPAPAVAPTSTADLKFVFPVSAAQLGDYLVRLRVGGAELLRVDRTKTPAEFDARQRIKIQ